MTPEWEEIKKEAERIRNQDKYVNANFAAGMNAAAQEILNKMAEIEKRTLSERVATLADNLDICACTEITGGYNFKRIIDIIANALRTGETSELEKWQRKT